MARKSSTQRAGKLPGGKNAERGRAAEPNDNWDSDSDDGPDYDERWLAQASREKERSRIQRQMQARRELERRREEKRLREQVEDWPLDE
jgi:hypothetical protein